MSRRAFHAVIALVLVGCLLSPYVETALGGQDSIFLTGRDTESTLALVILLLELVVALARVLVFFPPNGERTEQRLTQHAVLRPAFRFAATTLPDLSPPLPLRI